MERQRSTLQRPWWHSPWLWFAIVAIFVMAITGGVTGVLQPWSSNAPEIQLPSFQREANPPALSEVRSTESKEQPAVAPGKEWPRVPVVWTEVRDFNPSTIPVEEGFYNGAFPHEISWSPSDPNSVPAGDAFAWKILPHLREVGRGSLVTAVRAPENKDVVLVSIDASRNPPYILLSVDGEKSWCKLNLLWEGIPYGDATHIRVRLVGDEIHLYGRHPKGPGPDYLYWWSTTVKKSELPCS